MKKKILVTGGAGAIGSYLCRKYVNEGHFVYCLDNLQKTQDTKNIDDLINKDNFKFIKGDVVNKIKLPQKVDWIFNMACPVSCVDLQVDPVHTMKSSIYGIINVLDLAKKDGAKVVHASSSDIYGEMVGDNKFKEEDWGSVNTLSPRACYEEGKRASETICVDYRRMYGVDVKIARFFNTSGPGTHISDGRVLSNFIFAALSGRDILIYGDGSATRTFLHLNDCIDAIDKLIKKDSDFMGPINIGNDHMVSILDLAKMVISRTGSSSKISFTDADDAPLNRCPEISMAKRELGWEPETSLDDLIDDMVNHYQSKGLPEGKVLVFSTTYYPNEGPAERAMMELSKKMPQTQFHIITSRFSRENKKIETIDTDIVYRVGLGKKIDKYMLPILGLLKAHKLNKENRYNFSWSIVESYGGISAAIFKFLNPKVSFIILKDNEDEGSFSRLKSFVFRKVHKLADKIYSKNKDDLEVSKLLGDYRELLSKQEGKLTRPR